VSKLESIELCPGVIVYKNLIPNPDKIMEIIKESESNEDRTNSLFEDWEGWLHFGDQMSFPYAPDLTWDEINTNGCPEIITREIEPSENKSEYVSKVTSAAFYNSTMDYMIRNNVQLRKWIKMGLTICKYNRDGKDYAMAYHMDYDKYQEEKPGFKFGVTVCIYLNDDYEGGEVCYWNDNTKTVVEYKPYAGDVVVFLADYPIYHGVSKIWSGDKYFMRQYWGWNYAGSPEWHINKEKYGEEEWIKMETSRLKKEFWEGKWHYDIVWDESDLYLPKYQISEKDPTITPLYSPYPKIKRGNGNE
jgi:2OG-Fe(II) oxygenase superfamily